MIKTSNKKIPERQSAEHGFRVYNVFFSAGMLLALLSLISYSPLDWSIMNGGINAEPQNWIGTLGAYFSHILLLALGIAGYILVLLFLFRAIRQWLPAAGSFRNFITGTLLITAGVMLLLALSPEVFAPITNNFGLGRVDVPEKSLSGGLIGQFFAAPKYGDIAPGCLRGLIGKIGTMVLAWIMVIIGGVLFYVVDWHALVKKFVFIPGAAAAGSAGRSLHDWSARHAAAREAERELDMTVEEDDPADNGQILPEEDDIPEQIPPEKPVSRLAALLRSREKYDENDMDDVNDEEIPESVPLVNSVPLTPVPEASSDIPAASTVAVRAKYQDVQEIPAVGHKVVRQGENLRGSHGEFILPLITMLAQGTNVIGENSDAIELAKSKIQQTMEDFSIAGRVTGHVSGPRVTRYEITLDPGINVKKVEQIQDNIRMALAATSIRVLAPIPGRSVVGIEVSNSKPEAVFMRSVMESDEWKYSKAEIPLALGKNVSGKPVILDLAKAPHMLVAGATGTGKSVCSNSIITSLLFKFRPDELRLIMVDPKIVEFEAYKTLPHLLTPIINDSAKVPIALRWAANEMDHRYRILAKVGVKKLSEFNSRPRTAEPEFDDDGSVIPEKMPLLVIILDELADLMMTEAKKDVETNIARIAQKGRAAGIHIIVATQRPDAKIVTGVIKANLPTRLCFQVRSLIDSRVVLDAMGAEKLLGMGDMLAMTPASMELERVQGAWVKDDDIKNVVKFVSDQAPQRFNDTVLAEAEDADEEIDEDMVKIDPEDREDIAPLIQKYMRPGDDDTMRRALEVVIIDRKASTSYLQRRLRIGYNRAAELVDQLEERGIVGPPSGSGNKRDILVFEGIDIG